MVAIREVVRRVLLSSFVADAAERLLRGVLRPCARMVWWRLAETRWDAAGRTWLARLAKRRAEALRRRVQGHPSARGVGLAALRIAMSEAVRECGVAAGGKTK